MKITINEPCHENWDAMTPNTQGAFCKVCAKDVVDFSNKSLNQIKNFFSEERAGKVCARFKEEQLQELSVDDFVSKFQYWNITKKFAAIFFIAFGITICLSQNGMAQGKPMANGGVSYTPDKAPKKDTTQKHHDNYIQGGLKPINVPKKDTTKKQTTNPPKSTKMGKIKCERPKNNQSTTKGNIMIKGDVAAPIKDEPMIMGEMVAPPKQKTTPPKK